MCVLFDLFVIVNPTRGTTVRELIGVDAGSVTDSTPERRGRGSSRRQPASFNKWTGTAVGWRCALMIRR